MSLMRDSTCSLEVLMPSITISSITSFCSQDPTGVQLRYSVQLCLPYCFLICFYCSTFIFVDKLENFSEIGNLLLGELDASHLH
mmetsp:Transcript_22489/g.53806  ORF Transcript_22489/g.53806 Transcript_22489/m.53806 type:complete len:84 (+) Transcript_22489:494-745(+)